MILVQFGGILIQITYFFQKTVLRLGNYRFVKIPILSIFVINTFAMTLLTLHIDSKRKLTAIKTVLEAMNITYDIQEQEIDEKEQALLQRSEKDIAEGKVYSFKSHFEILGR